MAFFKTRLGVGHFMALGMALGHTWLAHMMELLKGFQIWW